MRRVLCAAAWICLLWVGPMWAQQESSAAPRKLTFEGDTAIWSVGIKPDTIVYNHLNQPRELVKGGVIGGIIG